MNYHVKLKSVRFFLAGILCITMSSVLHADIAHEGAVLRILDKIAGVTTRMNVSLGEVMTFAAITLTVRACYAKPPEELPDSAAWIEVREKERILFSGWMFAQSPALSAMSDPVYDVTLVECFDKDDSAEGK